MQTDSVLRNAVERNGMRDGCMEWKAMTTEEGIEY